MRGELGVELLLPIESGDLRWFRTQSRVTLDHLPLEVFLEHPKLTEEIIDPLCKYSESTHFSPFILTFNVHLVEIFVTRCHQVLPVQGRADNWMHLYILVISLNQ